MTSENLPSIEKEDDVLLQIEQLKKGLIAHATNGSFDTKEYSRFRKLILTNPNLEKVIPKFLRACRTTDEYWNWIKAEASTYQARRDIIAKEINPILEILEYENDEGSLEFNKIYEEKKVIGHGGFGMVYLYEHRLLNLNFAVKVFSPSFYQSGGEEKELERFFQEARILFKLNHPNIIKVYDAGLNGKRPFIRMEYFDGKNLNQILQEYGSLSVEKSIIAIKNIVSAIKHAHDNGVIHRDLKPSNIMASIPNQFRVIDFGLGIFIENELHSRLTKTGSQTISGYYNAPELVANPKLIDKKSDIYSIGAIWYAILCNQPPAGSNFMEILLIQGIHNDVLNIIAKCLNPIETRYTNCEELLYDIEKL